MRINDKLFERGERAVFALRDLYAANGYEYYRMSKFEEYDFYAKRKDFLLSEDVLTFTDTNGKLMALKPDVTLSIVKGCEAEPKGVRKVYYSESVYRPSATDSFKEITQTGLECFGELRKTDFDAVVVLAVKSLLTVSEDCILALSDLNVIDAALDQIKYPKGNRREIFRAIEDRNAALIDELLAGVRASAEDVAVAKEIFSLSAGPEEAIAALEGKEGFFRRDPALKNFLATLRALSKRKEGAKIRVDFSVVGDANYYNGVIFKGFVRNIPDPVLTGGRYDLLMGKLGKKARAIGFAVYTDLFDRMGDENPMAADDGYLNVALPKGRLGEKVYKMFAEAGYPCPELLEESRKLVFENAEKKVRYFWVKPSDVTIYVERGVADVGVAGKDIIEEYKPDVYELLDLKKGVCRMAVAGPKNFRDDKGRPLRVATKFASVARAYYQGKGRDIDVIHLNGSIEIAPILGLSDVIVDIVETGNTLRANGLDVIEEVFPISARLIANKSKAKFKKEAVDALAKELSAIVEAAK